MALRDDLKAKVSEKLGKEVSEVTNDARFIEDLQADSLDLMDFIMELEEDYNVEIPSTDSEGLKTFGDLATYMENKVKK
ncbi:acyl carrier protein [bacterium]|nr:acyl carrier protein [bacterium]